MNGWNNRRWRTNNQRKKFDEERDAKEENDETAALNVFQCISTLPKDSREQKVFTDRGVWKAASHASEIRCTRPGNSCMSAIEVTILSRAFKSTPRTGR